MEYYVKLNILYTYFVIKSESERYFGIALKLINTYFEKSSLLFSVYFIKVVIDIFELSIIQIHHIMIFLQIKMQDCVIVWTDCVYTNPLSLNWYFMSETYSTQACKTQMLGNMQTESVQDYVQLNLSQKSRGDRVHIKPLATYSTPYGNVVKDKI